MTNDEKVLAMLKSAGAAGVTNGEFANAGLLRYGSVIHRLRSKGHHITNPKPKEGNTWRYYYHGLVPDGCPSNPGSNLSGWCPVCQHKLPPGRMAGRCASCEVDYQANLRLPGM